MKFFEVFLAQDDQIRFPAILQFDSKLWFKINWILVTLNVFPIINVHHLNWKTLKSVVIFITALGEVFQWAQQWLQQLKILPTEHLTFQIKNSNNSLILINNLATIMFSKREYLESKLYHAFYAFESLTTRPPSSLVCGICGIIPDILYGEFCQAKPY